VTFLHK